MGAYSPVHFYALKEEPLSRLLFQFFQEKDIASPLPAEKLIELGGVYVNSYRVTDDAPIPEGSLVKAFPFPKRYPLEGLSFLPWIIFENKEFAVVNKPAPFPTHAVASNVKENLISFLEKQERRKFYVTSRLDVDTKGLILLAKSPEAQAGINALFYQGKVEKVYRALTEMPPPLGLMTHFQSSSPGAKKAFHGARKSTFDKECRLVIKSVDKVDKGFLCTLQLLTGRTHQIRGQLALLGCPIRGDSLYGVSHQETSDSQTSLKLECVSLAFTWKGESLHFVHQSDL